WYRTSVTIAWHGTDSTSGIAGCSPDVSYGGPDSGNVVRNGTCTDQAGNPSTSSLALKYDATAPSATATPDRQPNANGWDRAAVTIGWQGTDSTSGVASCGPQVTYNGPDSGNAAPNGTCTDNAGNVGARSFPLKYDASPPVFTPSPDRAPNSNGW